MGLPRIRELRSYLVAGEDRSGDHHKQTAHREDVKQWIPSTWGGELPLACPMAAHERWAPSAKVSRSDSAAPFGQVVVEVIAEDGTTGCGVTSGGELVCLIVEQHLSRFVEGRDPGDIESMWDMMWRALIPYGRKGVPIHALSGVDLALWDLHAKLLGQPVYALLGGKTKSKIPVYATTVRPDLAAKLGFVGCKYPCAYGPADGDEGLQRNVEIHAHWRDAVGLDLPLMIDCAWPCCSNAYTRVGHL